jgi:hypothetical protein
MIIRTAAVAATCTLFALSADASVFFSFADPGPGRELQHIANDVSPGVGSLVYDTEASLDFLVDASESGLGVATFSNVRLEMNLSLGTATQAVPGLWVAPVIGSFTFYTFDQSAERVRVDLLHGANVDGNLINTVLGSTGSWAFGATSDSGFSWTALNDLADFLGAGFFLAGYADMAMTVTGTQSDGPIVDEQGVFKNFVANLSFSGTATVIPAPSTLGVISIAGLAFCRRRRSA